MRQCNIDDFNKTELPSSFEDMTKVINNYYCPDSYKNITLAIQRMKGYE